MPGSAAAQGTLALLRNAGGRVADAVDCRAGDGIEGLVRRHHARRLRRVRWAEALAPSTDGWARRPPPRAANRLDVHVDGAAALPAIAHAIESAEHSVHVAGWHVAPGFVLDHEGTSRTVRDVLAAAAQRVEVRVLVWAGPPLPLFHPWRSEVRRACAELERGTRVRCAVDGHNRPMHCHHEKLVIVDGRIAFVGGIDLTDLAGDRFDRDPHPSRPGLGWHDVAVRLEGPAVADVCAHYAMRWQAVTGEPVDLADAAREAGGSTAQVVRTVPEHTYPTLPDGDFSLLESVTGALRSARRFIYIENQFLWSSEIVRLLSRTLASPDSDCRVVVLLPARPNNGADDTRGQLDVLASADRDGRLLACTIRPSGATADPVYVHAKLTIVDDRWMSIGSANLNEHSLFNDTEVNVVTDDAAVIRGARERLWSEHLALPEVAGMDAVEAIDGPFRGAIAAGVGLRALVPRSRRTERLLGPLQGLLVDG